MFRHLTEYFLGAGEVVSPAGTDILVDSLGVVGLHSQRCVHLSEGWETPALLQNVLDKLNY